MKLDPTGNLLSSLRPQQPCLIPLSGRGTQDARRYTCHGVDRDSTHPRTSTMRLLPISSSSSDNFYIALAAIRTAARIEDNPPVQSPISASSDAWLRRSSSHRPPRNSSPGARRIQGFR